ncbi:hypothetical protein EKO04_008630 [Ascochyta lentis]|uniref:Uncharacterized protein n=1 Tax=Ascochyta lentis TaxID=205686 RepID=A0A8H7IXC2_9PLEO|nr:hypothetical protein EKO04_008630 [Ascochyta lentis]
MDQVTDSDHTARHAGDSDERAISHGTDNSAASFEAQHFVLEQMNTNTKDQPFNIVVAGGENSGSKPTDSEQYGHTSTTASHNKQLGTVEPRYPRFRIFQVELDYCQRYPALAAFEKFIHDHRYDTILENCDYTTTSCRLRFIGDCLMLPKEFDVERFLEEHKACSEWLTKLGVDLKVGSQTKDQDNDGSVTYNTLSSRVIRGAQAFTGSSTPITLPATYTDEPRIQGSSTQAFPEVYRQPTTLGEIFAHPPPARHALRGTLRWMPSFDTRRRLEANSPSKNQVSDSRSVLTANSSPYSGFVYVVGLSSGTRQEGPRGHSKSGSLKELHSDAPSEQFNIGMLGDLQISIDELCAFFPLHYTWHGFMERLLGAEYSSSLTSRLITYYRGYNDKIRGNALRQRVEQQKKNHPNKGKDYAPTLDFSTGAWQVKIGNRKTSDCVHDDWNVVDLANGVLRLPTGESRRHLTMAIEHAQAEGNTGLMASELPSYINTYDIGKELPDMSSYNQHPDVTARETFQGVVKAADPRHS